MARPSLALAGALSTIFMLAIPAAAGATGASAAHTQTRGRCATHHSKALRHAARSFHHAHCNKGHRRIPSHKSKQLLFKAHKGVCTDAGMYPSAKDIRLVRAATLCLVNRERARHGEPALHWNERLVRAAQAHTESMAFGAYFEHVGPRGETPLMRMRRTGYIYSSHIGFEVGENIAWGSLWLGTPRAVVASWMSSPGHRANILDARYRDTGIGISPHTEALAHGQSGGIYTQDFGVRTGG
jgi:uncharacterized protein YkwD